MRRNEKSFFFIVICAISILTFAFLSPDVLLHNSAVDIHPIPILSSPPSPGRTPTPPAPPPPPPALPNLTDALKTHYREYFSDWFEPGTQISRMDGLKRRSSRKKNLHQKLVLSQMNTKKAAKLDMDDRAKIMHYFSKPMNGDGILESVRIEDMFGTCWSVPRACPPLPTVITVQAPAGIGKSSMLKYMCMKWGCHELWNSNFDALVFVECRTLNRLGSMTGREFMHQILGEAFKFLRLTEFAKKYRLTLDFAICRTD